MLNVAMITITPEGVQTKEIELLNFSSYYVKQFLIDQAYDLTGVFFRESSDNCHEFIQVTIFVKCDGGADKTTIVFSHKAH